MKKQNQGQPTNLAQLKRALCVGAEFEIFNPCFNTADGFERRRVNDADTTSIYSIVPFDATTKATTANNWRGSWLPFGKAAFWRFENGLCSRYCFDNAEKQTENNLVFSIRVIEKEDGRDEAFETWKAELDRQRSQKAEAFKKATVEESEEKNREQVETIVNPVLDIMRNGGEIRVDKNVKIFDANGGYKEQNVILYIAEKYGVSLPLKLKGWIVKCLSKIVINSDNTCTSIYRRTDKGGKSNSIYDYITNIVSAILTDDALNNSDDNEEEMTDEEIERFFTNSEPVFIQSEKCQEPTQIELSGDKDRKSAAKPIKTLCDGFVNCQYNLSPSRSKAFCGVSDGHSNTS